MMAGGLGGGRDPNGFRAPPRRKPELKALREMPLGATMWSFSSTVAAVRFAHAIASVTIPIHLAADKRPLLPPQS
jgi:hypothetical protein